MELYEVLNLYCHRNSGAVPSVDKKKHSFMLKRLFAAQYPIQCNLVNNLDSDPEVASNLVALLATRYTDLPPFLKLKVSQKKKKESILSKYEDEVLNKYMQINEIGFRELEEAYMFNEAEVEKSLNLIKKNFFENKDKVIVQKIEKPKNEETGLF
jgi:hypothetical protein